MASLAAETPKLNSVVPIPIVGIVTESGLERIPENPYIFAGQHHLWTFREAFPNQSYFQFFSKLKHIVNRYLSRDERDAIINACLRLIETKEHVETADDFRRQLIREAEDRKRVVAALKNIHSLTDQLARNISSLDHDPKLKDIKETKYFCDLLYEPLDIYSSVAPIKPVLRRIWQTSRNMIKEYPPEGLKSRDSELELWLSELARAYGTKITVGYKDGRRTSPFIEFPKTILFALPDHARMGRQDLYTGAALEERIRRWCRARRRADGGDTATASQNRK